MSVPFFLPTPAGGAPMPDVILYQDPPVTRSLDVARRFHKRHDNVLRIIDGFFMSVGAAPQNRGATPDATEGRVAAQFCAPTPEETEGRTAAQFCAPVPEETEGRLTPQNRGAVPDELAAFFRANFLPGEYVYESGEKTRKTAPMYYLTRDGFAYMAMGFTGQEAALWKVRFINLFNAMARELKESTEERLAVAESRARRNGFILGKMAVHGRRWDKERRRQVEWVLMYREARYTYKEIAKLTGLSPAAVRGIVRRYFHENTTFSWFDVDQTERDLLEREELHRRITAELAKGRMS